MRNEDTVAVTLMRSQENVTDRRTQRGLFQESLARGPAVVMVLAATFVACQGAGTAPSDGSVEPDTGVGPRTCNVMSDCAGMGICVGGICESVTPCTEDVDCSEGVCHTTRDYCVECDGRHMNECATGFTCQFDFTCVSTSRPDSGVGADGSTSACTGACVDRSACAADQVCKMGSCCGPPPRCFSPDDCPSSRPECNGATGQCFGGDDCLDDNECSTKPGCGGGLCECDAPVMGQPGICRVRGNECMSDAECNDPTKFCTVMSSPMVCLTAPTCMSDTQCANVGLVCDLNTMSPSFQRCQNGRPCPNGNECDAATQACQNAVCVAKNCVNTPSLCTASERCEPTTRQCIPNPLGPCPAGNPDCMLGYYCNDQVNPAQCEFGCRGNQDCPGGICNAAHQCQTMMSMGGSMVCGPCNVDTDCPAGSRCFDAPLGKLCYETCSSITMDPCDFRTTATCFFGNCSCVL